MRFFITLVLLLARALATSTKGPGHDGEIAAIFETDGHQDNNTDDIMETAPAFETSENQNDIQRILESECVDKVDQSICGRKKIKNRCDNKHARKECMRTCGHCPPNEEADFQKEAVDRHNYYRTIHGVPPLTWDEELTQYAQKWVDKLIEENFYDHSPDNKYGENLYMWYKRDGKTPVDLWYAEIEYYNFTDGHKGHSSATGHFTQLVWKGSELLGMARATSLDGEKTIIAAEYYPPGNWWGQYSDNVPPPKE